VIPTIWFLEINRINRKLGIESLNINKTEGDELTAMIKQGLISGANLNENMVCLIFFSSKKKLTEFYLK